MATTDISLDDKYGFAKKFTPEELTERHLKQQKAYYMRNIVERREKSKLYGRQKALERKDACEIKDEICVYNTYDTGKIIINIIDEFTC